MKKTNFLMTIAIILIATTQVSAKVWRVNNVYMTNAHFTSLSTAVANSSVLAGDTIYVEGSPMNYGSITLSKRLVILGSGYFLSDNDSTQANTYSSSVSKMTFSNGSQGSFVAGLYATGAYSSSSLSNSSTFVVNTNDITISNCYIENNISSASYSDVAILIAAGIKNITIKKCFLRTYRNNSSSFVIYLEGNNTNIFIYNNILKQATKASGSGYAIYMPTTSESIIGNNVIIGENIVYNSVVYNNIQIRGGFTSSASYFNTIQNNIGQSTQFGTLDGNKSNINMATVFTYAPGNENVDNHYRLLQPSSPAIGAGLNGIDCGVFAGIDPYKLSGLPAIPAIFDAVIPVGGTTTGGIDIEIKAKSHH